MGGAMSGGDRVANGQDTFPVDGLPIKPEAMPMDESVYWDTLMDQIPDEILRRVDAHQLVSVCESLASRDAYYAELVKDRLDKNVFSMWMRSVQAIERLSRVFGMAPIDRRRMKLSGGTDEGSEDEWSD